MHRKYEPDHHHHHRQGHQRAGCRLPWLAILPWLVLVYAATGLYSVRPNERAVVRRFGKVSQPLRSPGLHFGFPYPIDQVTRVKLEESKRVSVGMTLTDRSLGRASEPQSAECLTGDRNLIVLSAIVQYRITSAEDFLFNVADVPELLRDVAAAGLTSVVSSRTVDDVLTVERLAVQNEVMRIAQEKLDLAGAGIRVTSVSLEGTAPPQEVAEAFRDVASAREDAQRAINEAEGYAYRLLPQARGEAQRMVLDAEGYAAKVTAEAMGDAARFERLVGELKEHRELTARRLLLEAMEEILPRLKKIVLDGHNRENLDMGLIEVEP
jgi:membrane protease subunit HflK